MNTAIDYTRIFQPHYGKPANPILRGRHTVDEKPSELELVFDPDAFFNSEGNFMPKSIRNAVFSGKILSTDSMILLTDKVENLNTEIQTYMAKYYGENSGTRLIPVVYFSNNNHVAYDPVSGHRIN